MIDPTGHKAWYDQYLPLTNSDKAGIKAAEKDYNSAKTDAGRAKAHADANNIRSQYVNITTIGGEEYPDYSQAINSMLINHAVECQGHINDIDSGLSWFYGMVTHKAPWDIKLENRWKERLNVSWLGKDTNGNFNQFALFGQLITAEDLGNIHYGYVGSALNYGPTTIFYGGEAAAVGKWKTMQIGPPFYGDDPNDHAMIQKGIDWYNNGAFPNSN